MKYDRIKLTLLVALCALTAAWAGFCIYRAATGQNVLADVVVLASLGVMILLSTASFAGKASHARTHDAHASSLGDTAYRRLRRAGEISEAEWEQQRNLHAAAMQTSEPYISAGNISATAAALQPNEDGRELGDHGLIRSVLAALRSADVLPLPQRGVLKQLVYEMAYRFAADSGMDERDRTGILSERKAERKLDAYADHCEGFQQMQAAADANLEKARATLDRLQAVHLTSYALRVDEFARQMFLEGNQQGDDKEPLSSPTRRPKGKERN